MPRESNLRQVNGPSIQLDRIDIKILAALQVDGRVTNLKLAELVGLSATPCLQRVRRLEGAGYIRSYEAVVDMARLTPHFLAFIQVKVASQRFEDMKRFERYIRSSPLILECYRIGSEFDYLLKSVARDVCQHQELIDELLSDEIGVLHVASFIALSNIKQTRSIPLGLLEPSLKLAGGM
jgi:Lrp/AsnC family transcriptional regulator, regulator of ectoine-degradation genes